MAQGENDRNLGLWAELGKRSKYREIFPLGLVPLEARPGTIKARVLVLEDRHAFIVEWDRANYRQQTKMVRLLRETAEETGMPYDYDTNELLLPVEESMGITYVSTS